MGTNNTNQTTEQETKGVLTLSIIVGIVWWLVIEILFFVIDFHPTTGVTRLFLSVGFFAVLFMVLKQKEQDSSIETANEDRHKSQSASQPKKTTESLYSQSISQRPTNISSLTDAIQISKHSHDGESGRKVLEGKLQSMDEYAFEQLVAELWEATGWETSVTSGSGDRGIDIVATRTGMTSEKQAIQAKRYSDGNKVGSQDVRNYATLYQQEPDVDSVVIVTTSTFTKQAKRLAEDLNVKLVDGDSLCQQISQLAGQIDVNDTTSTSQQIPNNESIPPTESNDEPLLADYLDVDEEKYLSSDHFEDPREAAIAHSILKKRIADNENNKVVPHFEKFLDATQSIITNQPNSDEKFDTEAAKTIMSIKEEKKRLRELDRIEVPNEFAGTEEALESYIQSNSALVTEVESVLENDIEHFSTNSNKIVSLVDRMERSKQRLIVELQKDAKRLEHDMEEYDNQDISKFSW